VLVVLSSAFLVARTQTAHALTPCLASDVTCPVGVDDQYTVPFGQSLTVPAATGLLANDRGPAGTKIEFNADGLPCFDNSSWLSDAAFNVKADGLGGFTYVPSPPPDFAFSGIDPLSYCIVDPATGNDDQFPTANIAVIPTVNNDSYGMKPNTTLTVTANVDSNTGLATSGIAGNDKGIDPSSLTLDTTSLHGGVVNDDFNGAFDYTPPANFQGVDTFNYTGQDFDGDWVDGPMDPFDPDPAKMTVPMHGTVTIYVDGTPPVATMSAPGPVTLSTKPGAAWSATDPGGTGVANYDAQYTVAPYNGPYSAWAAWKTATTATTGTIIGTYGRTFCFHARARDRAGNVSPWVQRCTSVPLRSTSLAYTARWTRSNNPVYFGGTGFVTSIKGQFASLAGVQATRMWLVATKCPTCGTVQARWNNVPIANVSLASPVTVRHALIPIAVFPGLRSGSLRLYVTSPNGRGVAIEGLAVLRSA
jgi:hypothetical protein